MSNEIEMLSKEIATLYTGYKKWARLWSFVYHSFLVSAAVLSFLAALTTQIGPFDDAADKNVATVLAGLAGLCSLLVVTGGFERKWRTTRVSKASVQELRIELFSDSPDTNLIRKEMKRIIRYHNKGIMGGDTPTTPQVQTAAG